MAGMRPTPRACLVGLTAVMVMAACGQAPAAPQGGSVSPATVGTPLPARDAGQLDWQIVSLPQGTHEARADIQSVALLRIGQTTEPDDGRDELVVLRRTDGQRLAGYPLKPSYRPVRWVVRHSALLLVEQHGSGDQGFGLRAVDLESGLAQPVPLRSVREVLLDDPTVLGEEILVIGWTAPPRDKCLLALRPPAYTERIVECGLSERTAGLVSGPDGPHWTRDCQQWRRLAPDGSIHSLPMRAAACDFDSSSPVAVLAGWQLDQVNQGLGRPRALVASNPARTLGEVSNGTAVACGQHVYWVSATNNQPGQRLMRWRPGADHTETVLPAAPGAHIRPPHCVAGVLNIAIGPNAHRVPFHEFRVLDHP
jgi:hypothetical protein